MAAGGAVHTATRLHWITEGVLLMMTTGASDRIVDRQLLVIKQHPTECGPGISQRIVGRRIVLGDIQRHRLIGVIGQVAQIQNTVVLGINIWRLGRKV